MNDIRIECEKICNQYNVYIDLYLNDEVFIREFADRVNWDNISEYQQLSERFIREFADRVNWICISIHQNLSEGFIREFADRVYWHYISQYQKLSEELIKEYNLKISKHNWLYKPNSYKKNYIKTTTDFVIKDNYVVGYVNSIGTTSNCDCNSDCKDSFGLEVNTEGKYKVKVHIDNLGTVLSKTTLRCFRFEVFNEGIV